MNAREANLIAKRCQAREQAFDDLHALTQPFFRRTSLVDIMKEISECVSEVRHANTLCGGLKASSLVSTWGAKRYEQITQNAAPINGGDCYTIDPRLDHEVRRQLSHELGHGRFEVVADYMGGKYDKGA